MRTHPEAILFRLFAILLLALLASCQGDKASSRSASKSGDTSVQKKDFFPVLNFLKGEIRLVDSTPVGIKQFVMENGKTDSGYISREHFHRLAEEFLDPVLQEDSFSANFNESSFFDRSMKTSSFVYTPKNQPSSVGRVDIVTKEDASYDKVSSIYMEKSKDSSGSTILRKLYWNPGHGFQISTIVVNDGGQANNSQVKVVWDQGDY